jgi:hypothetical protein
LALFSDFSKQERKLRQEKKNKDARKRKNRETWTALRFVDTLTVQVGDKAFCEDVRDCEKGSKLRSNHSFIPPKP